MTPARTCLHDYQRVDVITTLSVLLQRLHVRFRSCAAAAFTSAAFLSLQPIYHCQTYQLRTPQILHFRTHITTIFATAIKRRQAAPQDAPVLMYLVRRCVIVDTAAGHTEWGALSLHSTTITTATTARKQKQHGIRSSTASSTTVVEICKNIDNDGYSHCLRAASTILSNVVVAKPLIN